nr:SET and MYND domain containing protein 5 [Hymenolepis microstoma]
MSYPPVEVVDLGTVKGRALVTTAKVKKGEVIFTERPLICCQLSFNRSNGHRCCDYCLKPLENPQDNARRLTKQASLNLPVVPGAPPCDSIIPIFHCSICRTEYCSLECSTASQLEYHTFICCPDQDNSFNRLEECWRSCHPLPETGTVMLLIRIAAAHFAAHFLKSERAQYIVTALSRFVSSPIVEVPNEDGLCTSGSSTALAHRLMGPTFAGDLSRLHALFVECVTEMAQRTGVSAGLETIPQQIGLDRLLTEHGFCSAMCLIGRNGQGIGSSSLGSWGKAAESVVEQRGDPDEIRQFSDFLDHLYETLDEEAGEFLNVEGVGLYARQSLINHSCDPNASVCFESGTNELSLVAEEDIDSPGTELTICYLDECMMHRSGHSRRRYLREHYLFICKCSRCQYEKSQQGYESVTSNEEMSVSDNDTDMEEDIVN